MTTSKKEYASSDAQPVVIHGKIGDRNDRVSYPFLMDSQGRLIVSDQSGNVSSATATSISVTTASTTVLATNPTRVTAIIINDSSNPVYLKYGTGATINSGIRLNELGGSLVEDLYTGIITAVVSTGTNNLTVTEL